MDMSLGMRVAIMFITILGLGIASLIIALASIFNEHDFRSLDQKMISWIVLLLLVHFDLFWETLTIFDQKDWKFSAFLFVIAGPVLLFFASQTLLTNKDTEIRTHSSGHYVAVSRRFFAALCLVMIWAIAVEFILGNGAVRAGLADLSVFVLFAVLAMAREERIHARLTVVAWVLIIGLLLLN